MPVHATPHLGSLCRGFLQRFKHGDGVNVLAGDGGVEFLHFGIFLKKTILHRKFFKNNNLIYIISNHHQSNVLEKDVAHHDKQNPAGALWH
jgi:hypothetical protein